MTEMFFVLCFKIISIRDIVFIQFNTTPMVNAKRSTPTNEVNIRLSYFFTLPALSVERRDCRALKKIKYKIYQVLSTCRDLLTLPSLYMLTVGYDKSQRVIDFGTFIFSHAIRKSYRRPLRDKCTA